MGAQQSSEQSDASGAAPAAKTCYYDLLGVERSATDDEYFFPSSLLIFLKPSETSLD